MPREEKGQLLDQVRAPSHLGPCLSVGHPASLGLGSTNPIPSFWDDFHIRGALGFAGLGSSRLSCVCW